MLGFNPFFPVVEFCFSNKMCPVCFQHSSIAAIRGVLSACPAPPPSLPSSQGVQVSSLLFLFLHQLLHPLLQGQAEVVDLRVVREDPCQYNEAIAYLHVVLGLQAHNQRFGQFKVPLECDVSEVFVVQVLLLVG